MTDSFYTPKILADKLISYVDHQSNFENAVDFCVGDGELLRAVEERWPMIKCYGSDISDIAIKETRIKHPEWILSKFDFLNHKSRSNSKLLRIRRQFDLILLNPPFTCKASVKKRSVIDGQQFSTSTSMNFIIEALKFLTPKGVMYAILPLSVAYSQKDSKVWKFLEEEYNLTILEETSTKYFKNCTPNIILVSLNDHSQLKKIKHIERSDNYFNGLSVFRGKLSIHETKRRPGSSYLVHTTNLKNNKIQELCLTVDYKPSLIKGPAILIPRVGKPDFSKVCIVRLNEEYCISDCIIALKCESEDLALTLFSFFANNWEKFVSLYRGTGAHYITNEKVEQYLNLDKVSSESAILTNS